MPKKVLQFVSKTSTKKTKNGDIVEHGTICGLNYEVYKRGVIHITDKKLKFKKDCDIFEDEINKMDFESLADKEEIVLKGSGENDHLIFTKKDGDVDMKLKRREFSTISKLKSLLSKNKEKK